MPDPRPETTPSGASRVSRHYRGERGAAYSAARQGVLDHPGFAINFSYFRPYLEPADRLLDFGCGNGGMLRLAEREVARAEGLEVNPTSAAKARGAGSSVYGSLDEIPAGARYDVVVSNHVLEHVRDVCSTLEALRRRLRPGGRFVTKLPIDRIGSRRQRRWSRDDPDHHLQTWTPRLFANCLLEAGFEVIEARVLPPYAWHPRIFPLIRAGLGPIVCPLLALWLGERELFAVGENPSAGGGG